MGRIKKPPVRPEQRRQWLHDHEINGESVPQIATRDGYDVRTVRKQIEQAQQEREIREARLTVLRNAMEDHFRDLVVFVEGLDTEVAREEKILDADKADRLLRSLKQHTPRSPLWKLLPRWSHVLERLSGVKNDLAEKLKTELESTLVMLGDEERRVVVEGGARFIVFVAESSARGRLALTAKGVYSTSRAKDGAVKLAIGALTLGHVQERHVSRILEVVTEYEAKIQDWDQYYDMERLYGELERLKEDIREELAIVKMRRVLPGRCKYCPV
jgi:hypothetical protein